MSLWQKWLAWLKAFLAWLNGQSAPVKAVITVGKPRPRTLSEDDMAKAKAVPDVVLFDDQLDPVALELLDKGGNVVTAPPGSTATWSSSDTTILTVATDPANSLNATVTSTGKVSVAGTPVVITAVVTLPGGGVLPAATQAFDVPGGAPVSAVISVGTPSPRP